MEEPPASYLCPISQEIMIDPVTCADGHSYDRRNIATWLVEHDTSPATGLPLQSRVLIPNIALRNAIDEWEDAQHRRSSPAQPPSSQKPPWSPCSEASSSTTAATPPPPPASAIDEEEAVVGGHDEMLPPGALVEYVDARGDARRARVVAVHPGGSEDPEPYFTIALDGGGERDTIRSRLKLVKEVQPSSPPQPPPVRQEDEATARREEEETARREAVERSRREAKQERRRRSQEAAEAAEAAAARSARPSYGAQMPYPGGRPAAGYPDGGYSGAPHGGPRPTQHQPRRPSGGLDEFDQALRGAGQAINGVGESIRGAADAFGNAFREWGQFLEGVNPHGQGPNSSARH